MANNINRNTLVEQAAAAIREYINSDAVQKGEKLPSEAALCEKYGVSRTTIREALRLLQAGGYVQLKPNKGVYAADKGGSPIANVSTWLLDHKAEVSDLLEVRMMIEPYAAALAAERATINEKYMIMGIHAMFQEEASKENLPGIILYDERFHECIMKASHNSLILELYKLLGDSIRSLRAQAFMIELAVEAHGRLANAIMEGDSKLAEEIMVEHLNANKALVSEYQKGHS